MRRKITPETWKQVQTACAAGIGLREIARNAGLPEGTVLAKAKREGWTQQIRDAKALSDPQSPGITPMQSAAVTMRQRAERHVERIAGVAEGVMPHLEAMEPAAVLDGIHEIEKFDRMARRNYGLDTQPVIGGALNVHILTNQAAIQFPACNRQQSPNA